MRQNASAARATLSFTFTRLQLTFIWDKGLEVRLVSNAVIWFLHYDARFAILRDPILFHIARWKWLQFPSRPIQLT
jgi:hypothetical protein